MNLYLLAHQTLVAQLQILTWLAKQFAFYLNVSQTGDLQHNGIISQQRYSRPF
jgi:hypothetical protein